MMQTHATASSELQKQLAIKEQHIHTLQAQLKVYESEHRDYHTLQSENKLLIAKLAKLRTLN